MENVFSLLPSVSVFGVGFGKISISWIFFLEMCGFSPEPPHFHQLKKLREAEQSHWNFNCWNNKICLNQGIIWFAKLRSAMYHESWSPVQNDITTLTFMLIFPSSNSLMLMKKSLKHLNKFKNSLRWINITYLQASEPEIIPGHESRAP